MQAPYDTDVTWKHSSFPPGKDRICSILRSRFCTDKLLIDRACTSSSSSASQMLSKKSSYWARVNWFFFACTNIYYFVKWTFFSWSFKPSISYPDYFVFFSLVGLEFQMFKSQLFVIQPPPTEAINAFAPPTTWVRLSLFRVDFTFSFSCDRMINVADVHNCLLPLPLDSFHLLLSSPHGLVKFKMWSRWRIYM